MNLSRTRPLRWLICAAVAALACLVAACTAPGGTKAGGASERVLLHIATVNSDLQFTPQISYLEKRVNQLSGGNVRIDVTPFVGYDAPDAELVRTIRQHVGLGTVMSRRISESLTKRKHR